MSVVGIDLGTTNTVVACVRSGKVHVLADEHGARLLPSVVSFHPNGEVLVGAAAKARRIIDPRNTVYSHKRLIGRSWGSTEIAQAKSRFAFELKEGPGQGPLIRARGQDYTLPEISAFVLKRTRQIAETALGTPVERAVITVPAHFNELQRASTKVAGRVSGLEVLRILNEPTAAALAYGLGRTGNERVAVYDFGGGTFDCTLLDLNGNVFEVLATAGDSFLGGDDVDNLIAERMAETYLKAHRYDPRTDPQMLERLKTTAEDIKLVLSTAETHTVVLKDFGHGAQGAAINFTFTMTRRDLDHMITPLVDRSFKVTQDALALARLSATSFDKIILVGGSTRMPLVRRRVEAFFGQTPLDRVNPDEVVAIGAAIQAAALTEGARRRSIPAPPNVISREPRKPRTSPGLADDPNESTQTGTHEAPSAASGPPAPPAAAFGSGPPTFGFHPASTAPPNNPAQRSSVPSAFATGPHQPIAADSHPRGLPSNKTTNPGLAPQTQPMGARGAPTAQDDDPSIASFPDVAVPTPFEWFPSSTAPSVGSGVVPGAPSAGGGDTLGDTLGGTLPMQDAPPGFREQAITATSDEQNSLPAGRVDTTAASAASRAVTRARDERSAFGAIDEPPSLVSNSVPSVPGTLADHQPSPIGEPEPFRESVPDEPFGAVNDLSLTSGVSGVSTSGVSGQSVSPSRELGFGHVADLSLVSTSSATAEVEDITEARQRFLEDFEDETESNKRPEPAALASLLAGRVPPPAPSTAPLLVQPSRPGNTTPGNPTLGNTLSRSIESPLPRPAPVRPDEEADLPAVAEPNNLPAVADRGGTLSRGGKRPEIRKPGQPAMTAQGGPSMLGKPPPMLAPQPFGPMEKIGAEGPPSRTGAMMPAKAPPPSLSSKGAMLGQPARASTGQAARTAAMPARPSAPASSPPMNTTAPLDRPPSGSRPAASSPATFGSGLPTTSFRSAPPPPITTPGPHGFGQTAPLNAPLGIGYAPPPPGFAPPAQQGYGSAPPPPFGSMPPQAQAQAQAYGASAPLDVSAMQQADYNNPSTAVIPGGAGQQPQQGQQLGFAAPVLVDVTPRGLVVETAGGYTDTIIPRNAKIPCERTRRFATGRDMQTTVRVRVGQGEQTIFPQNTFLGEVELSGLRPAPRGEVVVAVTFEVDADGTLRVRARDVQTGQEARATLQLVGVADESSVVMMINRFAQQPVVGQTRDPRGPH